MRVAIGTALASAQKLVRIFLHFGCYIALYSEKYADNSVLRMDDRCQIAEARNLLFQ